MKLNFGKTPPRRPRQNPLIAAYGSGPEGKRCMDCAFLQAFRQARAWYKCEKRINTKTPRTDYGKNWQACGAFVEKG